MKCGLLAAFLLLVEAGVARGRQEATPAKFACGGATPNDITAARLLDFLGRSV